MNVNLTVQTTPVAITVQAQPTVTMSVNTSPVIIVAGAVTANNPTNLYGTGSPPDATLYPTNTLYFKYTP